MVKTPDFSFGSPVSASEQLMLTMSEQTELADSMKDTADLLQNRVELHPDVSSVPTQTDVRLGGIALESPYFPLAHRSIMALQYTSNTTQGNAAEIHIFDPVDAISTRYNLSPTERQWRRHVDNSKGSTRLLDHDQLVDDLQVLVGDEAFAPLADLPVEGIDIIKALSTSLYKKAKYRSSTQHYRVNTYDMGSNDYLSNREDRLTISQRNNRLRHNLSVSALFELGNPKSVRKTYSYTVNRSVHREKDGKKREIITDASGSVALTSTDGFSLSHLQSLATGGRAYNAPRVPEHDERVSDVALNAFRSGLENIKEVFVEESERKAA